MIYTYEELSQIVDEWWESSSEDSKHFWYMNPDPTFEQWVLSSIKPGDTVEIDYEKYNYKII